MDTMEPVEFAMYISDYVIYNLDILVTEVLDVSEFFEDTDAYVQGYMVDLLPFEPRAVFYTAATNPLFIVILVIALVVVAALVICFYIIHKRKK